MDDFEIRRVLTHRHSCKMIHERPRCYSKSFIRHIPGLRQNINGSKCFEMQHATLVHLGVRWLSRKCSVVLYEAAATKSEIPDVIGWAGVASTLSECKASRADFLRDAVKKPRAKES